MNIRHLLLVSTLFTFSIACQKKMDIKTIVTKETIDDDKIGTYMIKFADAQPTAKFLFENDEPQSVSFNANHRSFSTLEPLQLSLKQDSLKIKFYSPRPIKDVIIYGTTIGYPQKIVLAKVDSIPAFVDLSVRLEGINEERFFKSVDGKIVKFPGLQAGDVHLSAESEDAYFQKLKQIKINWICRFSPYSRAGDWAKPILPPHMKEAVAIALNMTYVFGSEEYRDSLLGPWVGRFYGNGGKKDTIDNVKLLANILDTRRVVFGHVIGKGGLGGNGAYGLAQYQYLEHYADDKSHQETMIHEFGHNLGYNHDSGMTYGNWWGYGAKMYERMSVRKELPVYTRSILKTRTNPMLYGFNPNNTNYPSKFEISVAKTNTESTIICSHNYN